MGRYSRVLLAVDLTEECKIVAEQALAIAESFGASLDVVHVIEPFSVAYGGDVPMDLTSVQDTVQEQAQAHLSEFCAAIDIADEHQHLVFGRTESGIQSVAEDTNTDIIVVGNHGRHGLALLVGSTARGLLGGVSCDVLAVKVGDE